MNSVLKKFARSAFMFGVDFRKILALRNILKYLSQKRQFKLQGGRISELNPILTDYYEQAGVGKGHYFHQDLLVASYIASQKPLRHIDIGSRIDGFVAHVASFREIEVIDVRELKNIGHKNITFLQANLMVDNPEMHGIADSISCLHAIEHFGLGRYGDPIDPEGHIKGFNNILKMLKPGGTLYISLPVASKSSVVFNAHRIFGVKEILKWANSEIIIKLRRFDLVDDNGDLQELVSLDNVGGNLKYSCGIYTFQRV